MSDRERTESGQFVETVTLEGVLGVFDRVDGPVITSSDVAGELGCTTEAARQKLRRLYDRGEVGKRKTGRTVVYWRADTSEHTAPRDASQRDEVSTPSDRSPVPDVAGEGAKTTGLEGVTFPGGRDRDDCEAAVLAARDYLREDGPATMREIVAEVMPEHPVGYDVPDLEPGDRYRGAWWRKVVKPGLKALEDVEPPARGASAWRHVGE